MDNKNQTHNIIVENRQHAQITGVEEMISATEKTLIVKLADGNLQINGSDLKIDKLAPEEKLLRLSGTIQKIEYMEGKKSFFKKLFR